MPHVKRVPARNHAAEATPILKDVHIDVYPQSRKVIRGGGTHRRFPLAGPPEVRRDRGAVKGRSAGIPAGLDLGIELAAISTS